MLGSILRTNTTWTGEFCRPKLRETKDLALHWQLGNFKFKQGLNFALGQNIGAVNSKDGFEIWATTNNGVSLHSLSCWAP